MNIGGTLGPVMAWLVRKQLGWGMENVFRVSALSVFLMFWSRWAFSASRRSPGEQKVASVAEAIKNMFVVLRNFRFVLFLLIFLELSISSFGRNSFRRHCFCGATWTRTPMPIWCSPSTRSRYLLPDSGQLSDPQDSYFSAMTLGLMISSLAWLILAIHPSTLGLVAALVVLALGEITQSARYYEYISRLAPPGQQGLYMGYAFLPIAIGYFIAGPLGAFLLHEFGDVLHRPRQMWWVVTAIGLVGAVLTVIYDRVSVKSETSARNGAVMRLVLTRYKGEKKSIGGGSFKG